MTHLFSSTIFKRTTNLLGVWELTRRIYLIAHKWDAGYTITWTLSLHKSEAPSSQLSELNVYYNCNAANVWFNAIHLLLEWLSMSIGHRTSVTFNLSTTSSP